MAKCFASEIANTVAYKAVQIHGGYGYMREYEVERIYRDVRLITIGAGTSQIMKNIIAKQFGVGDSTI
jgi:alkylation response protein AidB-like acyl-CoA dehydrogenase